MKLLLSIAILASTSMLAGCFEDEPKTTEVTTSNRSGNKYPDYDYDKCMYERAGLQTAEEHKKRCEHGRELLRNNPIWKDEPYPKQTPWDHVKPNANK